jgi:hypothetical protein
MELMKGNSVKNKEEKGRKERFESQYKSLRNKNTLNYHKGSTSKGFKKKSVSLEQITVDKIQKKYQEGNCRIITDKSRMYNYDKYLVYELIDIFPSGDVKKVYRTSN